MSANSTVRRLCRNQKGITMIELLVTIIVTGIVTAMLVGGWINLQRGSSFALASNSARGDGRDVLSRVSSELRNCQPTAFPTASPSPTAQPDLFVTAQPTDATFYSAYNDTTEASDQTGTGVRLTRMWLSTKDNPNDTTTATSSPARQYLYWRRDTNGNGSLDSGDRTRLMARFVVNNGFSIPVFRYGHLTSSGVEWNSAVTGADIKLITAVEARVIIDTNPQRPPVPVDLTTTVRLRNSTTY